jgi:predicted DNA-binding protein YlxM (UPF0122 family)
MENKIYLNSLLDFYSPLLTEKQQRICQYYYREDLSLQEIAELENTSRSAVYDTVKRCRNDLESYEDKLHLYRSYQKRSALYQKIRSYHDQKINTLVDACIDSEIDEGEKNI